MAKTGNQVYRFLQNHLIGATSLLVFVLILLFGLLLRSNFALAAEDEKADQPKVVATVDQNKLAVGDTFTFTVSVTSSDKVELGEPRLPEIEDFELINSWSGSEMNMSYSNGELQRTHVQTFNFMLSPVKEGELELGPARLLVAGQEVKTQPIKLSVGKESSGAGRMAQPRPLDLFEDNDALFDQLLRRQLPSYRTQPVNPNEAFFIQVEVDKQEAFVNEQVTASWYLYTRGQIRDLDTLQYPSVNGFWKEEIELATRLNFEQEVVNGIAYKKALLASYALFPINPGKATVDEYKAKCTVITPSNFGFGRPYQFTKSSKPIKINVKPLPTEERPLNFSGAVGRFRVQSTVSANSVEVNQPVTLSLKFEGRGNAKLIDLPSLDLDKSIEVYDTKEEAQFFKTGLSYKNFEILLIPREVGRIKIPEIATSLFDAETSSFYEIKAESFEIVVSPQQGMDPTAQDQPLRLAQQETDLPKVYLSWKSESFLEAPGFRGLFWGGLYSLAALAFGFIVKRERSRDLKPTLRALVKIRTDKMKSLISTSPVQWRAFGKEGANAIYFVLGQLSGDGGAHKEFDQLLLSLPPSVRRNFGESLKELLSQLEWLSFAPEEVVGSQKDKEFLVKLHGQTEKVLNDTLQVAELEQSS